MGDSLWPFVPLTGLLLVFIGNGLRARRTGDAGCLGHLFVGREKMKTAEWVLNRVGIALFIGGVVMTLLT